MNRRKIRITIEYYDNTGLKPEELKEKLNKALKFSTIEQLLDIDTNDAYSSISKKFEIITPIT